MTEDKENVRQRNEEEVWELVAKLMSVEKEGERLAKEKEAWIIEFEWKVVDDKEQTKKISQLALHSFLKSAEKDFQEFNKKLHQDM